jgi:hypothetical protein
MEIIAEFIIHYKGEYLLCYQVDEQASTPNGYGIYYTREKDGQILPLTLAEFKKAIK